MDLSFSIYDESMKPNKDLKLNNDVVQHIKIK